MKVGIIGAGTMGQGIAKAFAQVDGYEVALCDIKQEWAEGAGIGLSVEMKKMTVRQETIEVCEVFHLNPYQLTSTGAVLMVTPKGEELKERLKREGIPAEIIGHTTEGNERIIWGGGEKRFLDRPAPDELARIYEMKENVNA